jgi:alcohol dehydrogenase class IV
MAVFTISYLTQIEFGSGALAKLTEGLAALGVRRPLLVSDRGLSAAGLVDRAAALCPAGSPAFLDVATNPTEAAVLQALEIYRSEDCDGAVALGGGSPIDLAKAGGAARHP